MSVLMQVRCFTESMAYMLVDVCAYAGKSMAYMLVDVCAYAGKVLYGL